MSRRRHPMGERAAAARSIAQGFDRSAELVDALAARYAQDAAMDPTAPGRRTWRVAATTARAIAAALRRAATSTASRRP